MFRDKRANPCNAFSRVDLAVTLGVVAVLAATTIVFIIRFRHLTPEAQCADNLKGLGLAMSLYEKENHDKLPYAFIKYEGAKAKDSKVWDELIYPFVPPGQGGRVQKHLLRCPADTIARKGDQPSRTFAMPAYNMAGREWPPAAESTSGVGLWWGNNGKGKAMLTNIVATTRAGQADTNRNPICLPAITLAMIKEPSSTLLLTEHAQAANIAFNFSGSTIGGPSDHVDKKVLKLEDFHAGRINYLMVDGHTERLLPLQSIGQGDPMVRGSEKDCPNMWTIRAND